MKIVEVLKSIFESEKSGFTPKRSSEDEEQNLKGFVTIFYNYFRQHIEIKPHET